MEYQIDRNNCNQRIDKFLKRMLKDAPVSFIYKMFRQKDVKVNGKRVSIDYLLKEGDQISVYSSSEVIKRKNLLNSRVYREIGGFSFEYFSVHSTAFTV